MPTSAPDSLAAGLLLAATAAGDTDASQATLGTDLRARVEQTLRGQAALRAHDRAAALRTLLATIAPRVAIEAEAMPARARAVVAALAPREVGMTWMRLAGSPRVGFRATASLRTTLACTEVTAWRA